MDVIASPRSRRRTKFSALPSEAVSRGRGCRHTTVNGMKSRPVNQGPANMMWYWVQSSDSQVLNPRHVETRLEGSCDWDKLVSCLLQFSMKSGEWTE